MFLKFLFEIFLDEQMEHINSYNIPNKSYDVILKTNSDLLIKRPTSLTALMMVHFNRNAIVSTLLLNKSFFLLGLPCYQIFLYIVGFYTTVTLNYIWYWGSCLGDLGCMEYRFIDITPMSTLAQSSSTC